jgi:hypothetical protein
VAGGQTSSAVNDWQTVQPNDWQPVTEESEHARQLSPGVAPPARPLNRLLAPKNETANPEAFDPNTLRGYAARSVEALKGIGGGIVNLIASPPPGTQDNPIIWNPITQAKKDWQGIKEWNELRETNPDYAWGSILGPMLLAHTASSLLEPAGVTAKLARGAGVDPAYIEPVVNDLRAASKGAPPKTIGDFIDTAGKAEKTLNDEFDDSLGKYGSYRSNLPDVDGNFPIATAIRMLKDRMPLITDADRAEWNYVNKAASEYEKPITLHELDLKRMQANGRLDAYYNKSDVGQYAAETKNAQILIDKTVANWVRDNVYPDMDQLTGKPPGYFRNLKSRVGNLMNAQSEAKKFAAKVHRESAVERGSTPMERVRPGGAVSMRGGIHGYISNIPQMFRAADPEAEADSAVRAAFGLRQRVSPPPEELSVPVAAIAGATPKGPKTRKLEQDADYYRTHAR